jgi:hypothetical protein
VFSCGLRARSLADRLTVGLERGSWHWGINWSLNQYARPSLPLLSRQPKSPPLLPAAMPQQWWPGRSNRAASRDAPLPFSLMAPCVVRLGKRCVQQKSAGRRMVACGWSTLRVSATVEAVRCANSGSFMVATREIPRRVSVLLHPLQIGPAPLLWKDWSRRQHRRAWMQLLRHQRVDVHLEPLDLPAPMPSSPILSRAQRAHASEHAFLF